MKVPTNLQVRLRPRSPALPPYRLIAWMLTASLFSGYSLLTAHLTPSPTLAQVVTWTLISALGFALITLGHPLLLWIRRRGWLPNRAVQAWLLFYGVFFALSLLSGWARSQAMTAFFAFPLTPQRFWGFALNMTASGIVMILVLETLWSHHVAQAERQKACERHAMGLLESRALLVREDDHQHQVLAEFLHGPVQSNMVVAWAKMAQACAAFERDPALALALSQETQLILNNILNQQLAFAHTLIPGSDLGGAFQDQVKTLVGRFRQVLPVDLRADVCLPGDAVAPEVARSALLMLEELLLNGYRHANASQVKVDLGREGPHALRIAIQDDGIGFDSSQVKLGLGLSVLTKNLEALGGECRFRSAPEAGTSVTLRVPLLRSEVPSS